MSQPIPSANSPFCFKHILKNGALALFGLTAFQSTSADAEVRLGREATGGDFSVSVMTWRDIPFRSVVRQRYDFSCGSAAVATLLTYHYDRPTVERTPFKAMWELGDKETIRKVGFSMLDMRNYLESVGYRAEGFQLKPEQLFQVKRPVIVLLNLNGFKHFVVVKGQTKDQVLVGDSVLGLNKYSTKDFNTNKKPRQIALTGLWGKLVVRLSVADFYLRLALTAHCSANSAKTKDHERPCGWFRNRTHCIAQTNLSQNEITSTPV